MQQHYDTLGVYCALLQREGLLAVPPLRSFPMSQEVRSVSDNSQHVISNTLFVCKGAHFKPEYLVQAAQSGALAYVSETPYPDVDLPCIQVTDIRRALPLLAVQFYHDPSQRLPVIGITGTKGKSTTTYYLKYILDAYLAQRNSACGVISSIDTYDGVEQFESHLTTPEPIELQRHFSNAIQSGLGYMVMEVSSQALKYHRTLGTHFAASCFLNIGEDHISPVEHTDFEDYFQSKLKLFAQTQTACVNLDADHAPRILSAAHRSAAKALTFSRRDRWADVFARRVRKVGEHITLQVEAGHLSGHYQLSMPGMFNVENALAAITICLALNIPQWAVQQGLEQAQVPGRMEVFQSTDRRVVAVVDYAHNRMSFEALFRSVAEEYPKRRIVTVFGCPGKKAFDRRRDLGEVSGKHSQFVILTEEDSGEENTMDICREIAAHVEAAGCPYDIQPNRGEAIRQAVLGCKTPSVLLITGKGAETRQKRGLEYIETPSDVDYVRTFLEEYEARQIAHLIDTEDQARA